jgi:hypothetical protein
MTDCLTRCWRGGSSGCRDHADDPHKRRKEIGHENLAPDVGDLALIEFHCVRLAFSRWTNVDDPLDTLAVLYFHDFHVSLVATVYHIFVDLLGLIVEVLCTAEVLRATEVLSTTAHSVLIEERLHVRRLVTAAPRLLRTGVSARRP